MPPYRKSTKGPRKPRKKVKFEMAKGDDEDPEAGLTGRQGQGSSRCSATRRGKSIFVLGLLLGAAVATGALYAYWDTELREQDDDDATAVVAVGSESGSDSSEDGSDGSDDDDTDWIGLFAAVPDADSARQALQHYAAEPHIAGSDANLELAEYTRDLWTGLGIESELKQYNVLLHYPVRREINVTGVPLQLDEDVIPGDNFTADPDVAATFNGYSPSTDGVLSGEVVYVNYGSPQDFNQAKDMGVQLDGKIALIRYGGGMFRGLKVMVAAEFGVSGVILFSDPADDGFTRGDVYPDGPWRPAQSVQRGSCQYASLMAGDPLTPGVAATPDMPPVAFDAADTGAIFSLPSIPVHPISYGDASEILSRMDGAQAPDAWQGGLDLTYRVNGSATVDMLLEMEFVVKPIYNVIGTVEGEAEPDVIGAVVGNHRDAWAGGGVDPNSGSAALDEVARGVGALLAEGWRPRRTLKLASWDAEEYGLLGSTEWVEETLAELQASAAAYLNLDDPVGTTPVAEGTPSLSQVVLAEAANAGLAQPEYGLMGSGSDHAAFYFFAGVSAVNVDMSGDYGVYHSSMDSYEWVAHWSDPTFANLRDVAVWWGRVALRLVDDEVLPFVISDYAAAIGDWTDDLEATLAAAGFGGVSLDGLRDAAAALGDAAAALEAVDTAELSALELRAHNDKLMGLERAFLMPDGLEGRPFYKHALMAPRLYSGYSGGAFPTVFDVLDRAVLEGVDATEVASASEMEAAVYAVTARVWTAVGTL